MRVLQLLILLFFFSSVYSQEYLNPYVEKSTQENITITKISIEKNKTVVHLLVRNNSTNSNYDFSLAGTDSRGAHYLYDSKMENKYVQKFVLSSDVTCCQSTRFSVAPLASRTIKLVFQKIDADTKSLDMNEGTNSGNSSSWDFKGIKLMGEEELQLYKKQKAEEEIVRLEKEKQEKLLKEQEEEKRKEENTKKETERIKNAEAARVAVEKRQVKELEETTIRQTVKTIEYDGAYIDAGGKYYFMKPASVSLGRFGRCVGGSSDFNLMRTYFLSSLNGCVAISNNNKKIILSGSQNVSGLSNYKFSELRNFSKDFGMCVWNLSTDREQSFAGKIPTWTPKLNPNDITDILINEIKLKTINVNRAEIYISDALKKGNYYVLFNTKTLKYFIFYVK